MKMKNYILLLVIFGCLISCDQKQVNIINANVIGHHYHWYKKDSIIGSDSLLFDKSFLSDSVKYTYRYKSSGDTSFSFTQKATKNKSLNYFGIECPLIDKREYKIGKQIFTVNKYYYDVINSSDEEQALYFYVQHGLLIVDNETDYGLAYTIEYDSISRILIETIFKDKPGFFAPYSIRPPTHDSLFNPIQNNVNDNE
jgi:hypothetical protein